MTAVKGHVPVSPRYAHGPVRQCEMCGVPVLRTDDNDQFDVVFCGTCTGEPLVGDHPYTPKLTWGVYLCGTCTRSASEHNTADYGDGP